MSGRLAREGHRGLLVAWRYLPHWARRIGIRVLYPRFAVGAVAIVRDDAGRVLLVRQTYHLEERWSPPGGWLRPKESPRQAAARETFEEIGLRVEVGPIVAVGGGGYGEVSLAFECYTIGEQPFRYSDETDRAGYFAPDRYPPMPLGTRALLDEALETGTARGWLSGPARPASAGVAAREDR